LAIDAALPILDHLHSDKSLYVRKSVANHLHDISIDRPELAVAVLERWKGSSRATSDALTFIARNTLRTKLKQGWAPAYAFLGFDANAAVDVSAILLSRSEFAEGDTLTFTASLTASEKTPVHVTYVISSTAKSGRSAEKVHFLTRAVVNPSTPLTVSKKHVLRSTANWKITPGSHTVAIQVNGRRFPAMPFQVLEA
jgi:hypothetical protein